MDTRTAVITSAITLVGVILAALIARWTSRGSRRLTDAQRESIEVETAERVARMLGVDNERLAARVTVLETELAALRLRYVERERELEEARGEVQKLRAEVGTLRANLAARETELAALRAQATTTPGGAQ